MSIADLDGQTRSAFIQQQLTGPNAKLLDALSQRFVVRLLQLRVLVRSRRVGRGPEVRRHRDAARRQALDRARDELSGLPLAGLVMVSDGADTSDAAHRRDARQPEGALDSGVHRRRRPGTLRARRPGHAGRDAAQRAQGHRAGRRRRAVADRLRRPDDPAQRRRRWPDREHAGGDAAARRRVGDREGALHRERGRRAHVQVQGADAGRRAGHAEQRARRADPGQRPRREGALLRGRAALRVQVPALGRRRRQEPAGGLDRPHRGEQVLPAVAHQPRRADRRLPQDARGAVPVSRPDSRQRRSGVVHAGAAADDRRLRQQARRRSADARRPPLVRRRRLGRHAGRRGAAGRPRERQREVLLRAVPGAPDARRRDLPGHADRRRREGLEREVERDGAGVERQPDPRRPSPARRCC